MNEARLLWTLVLSAWTVCVSADVAAQIPLQLDETCTVTLGNQTVVVNPDGTFVIPNVAIFQSADTGIPPQLFRVRAVCNSGGASITGQSGFFNLAPGQTALIGDILPVALSPIPTSLSVTTPANEIAFGQSVQLSVTAHFADGSSENRTGQETGTTYVSTNSDLLTVSAQGLVAGTNDFTQPMTGTIVVLNEGNVTTLAVTSVGLPGDFDNDGLPNEYEDLFGLDPLVDDSSLDLDGDGLTNLEEFLLGSLPNNADTDGDGIVDGIDGDPLHPEEAPPEVIIVFPWDGVTLVEGATVLFSADVSDDGLVTSVEMCVGGDCEVFGAAPFERLVFIPFGVSSMTFSVLASDSVPNETFATSTVTVIPDPLTTVVGRVVDVDDLPVEGAVVTTNGGLTSVTSAVGEFSTPGVQTVLGEIVASAEAVLGGFNFSGVSAPVAPVLGGVTDVADIVITDCGFDDELGQNLFQSDDDYTLISFADGFTFPYFGIPWSDMYVNSNGNITFGTGDTAFSPSPIPSYVVDGPPRISPVFVDLDPGQGGGVYFKQLPDRVVVTWFQVPEYPGFGMNTVQAVLYADGRLDFIYNGLTADGTYTGGADPLHDISVAISPGGSPPLAMVDYTADAPFGSSAGEAVFENLLPGNVFDMDFRCLGWRPNEAGGYDVQLVDPTPPALFSTGRVRGVVRSGSGGTLPWIRGEFRRLGDLGTVIDVRPGPDGSFRVEGLPLPAAVLVRVFDDSGLLATGGVVLTQPHADVTMQVSPPSSAGKF